MRKSNIIDYKNPSQNLVTDVLSEFLRESAQKMLQLAIEEEVQNFISSKFMMHTQIIYKLIIYHRNKTHRHKFFYCCSFFCPCNA